MKISHIGYAVKDIDSAVQEFEKIGYKKLNKKVTDTERNVVIQFMDNNGYCVELISPLNEKSPIINILKKSGDSPYHFCYETSNIFKKIDELRGDNYLLIEPPSKAVAMENKLVAFLYKKNVGIVELVENPKTLGNIQL